MAAGKKTSAAGRPPKFDSPEQMQDLIEAYFKDCQGYVLKDGDGEIVFDKYGQPVILDERPPTITGLALALGFSSRQALLNYQAKRQFVDTVTRAKSRVEEYAETRLFDKDGATGAKFSLANNFKGWAEKVEADVEGLKVVIPKEVKDFGD